MEPENHEDLVSFYEMIKYCLSAFNMRLPIKPANPQRKRHKSYNH